MLHYYGSNKAKHLTQSVTRIILFTRWKLMRTLRPIVWNHIMYIAYIYIYVQHNLSIYRYLPHPITYLHLNFTTKYVILKPFKWIPLCHSISIVLFSFSPSLQTTQKITVLGTWCRRKKANLRYIICVALATVCVDINSSFTMPNMVIMRKEQM